MTCGHFGHQPRKQRRQKTSEAFNESGFFCNLQKAQPQRECAEQQNHHFDRQPSHRKQTLDHRCENGGVAHDKPTPERAGCSQKEEA